MRRFTLSVPFPVPLHACFVKSKGGTGAPSKRYRDYGKAFAQAVASQGHPRAEGQVSVHVAYCAPDGRARDAGNLHKCLYDNLVRAGVITDDSNKVVLSETTVWVHDRSPCVVTITELLPRPEDVPC